MTTRAFWIAFAVVGGPLLVFSLLSGVLASTGSECADRQVDAAIQVWQSGAIYAAVATAVMIWNTTRRRQIAKGILLALGVGSVAGLISGIGVIGATFSVGAC